MHIFATLELKIEELFVSLVFYLCQDYSGHIGNTLVQGSMTKDFCLKHLYLITSADHPKQGVTSGNKNKYLGWKTSSAKCSSPRCC